MWIVFFFMSKASCIFVAYSELQVRKTLKPFKFVLFSLQFWHILKCSRIADFMFFFTKEETEKLILRYKKNSIKKIFLIQSYQITR